MEDYGKACVSLPKKCEKDVVDFLIAEREQFRELQRLFCCIDFVSRIKVFGLSTKKNIIVDKNVLKACL